MGVSDDTCICRRLVALGLVDALQGKTENGRFLVAIRSCMRRSACPSFDLGSASTTAGGGLSERSGADRRSGKERRQKAKAWLKDQERRSGKERRSGGDRRGLTPGQSYTQEQTFKNLQAWCADKCQAPYKLWLGDDGNLRFRFEQDSDRDRFLAMLRNFQQK